MDAKPQKEHEWLRQLVGEWTFEAACAPAPGQPESKNTGVETVRMLGGLWTLGEGRGEMPGGGEAITLMTLGYDPETKRFVGTFIGSMMTHMWVYNGQLDAAGKVLTLDTEGPTFTEPGKSTKYKDIIEFKTKDHRILSSQTLGDDGKWHHFMTAHYRRKK